MYRLPGIILLTPTKSSMLFMTRTTTSSFVNIGLECLLIVFYPETKKAPTITITAMPLFLKHITWPAQHTTRFIYDFTQILPSNILNLCMDPKLVILCMLKCLPMSETTIRKWGCHTVIPRPHHHHTLAWNISLYKMGNAFSLFFLLTRWLFLIKKKTTFIKSMQ